MSTHNIGFYEEISKIITKLSPESKPISVLAIRTVLHQESND